MIRRLNLSSAEAVALGVLTVGAVAALALLYLLTRPLSPAGTPAPIPVTGTAEGGPSETPSELVVHVAGLVRRPGLVTLPGGARVADAISAAGGPRGKGTLDSLNLARPVADGEQLVVGAAGAVTPAPGQSPGTAAGGGTVPGGSVVNLNTADAAQLEELPGIGPVLAARILEHRDSIGGFTEMGQLRDVPGIGEKTFQSLAQLVAL